MNGLIADIAETTLLTRFDRFRLGFAATQLSPYCKQPTPEWRAFRPGFFLLNSADP